MWSHTSLCDHISCTDSHTRAGRATLPWKSGGHVQQDAPPLLPLMELPDPRRSISASTHKPDGDNRHSHSVHRPTDVKVAAMRS